MRRTRYIPQKKQLVRKQYARKPALDWLRIIQAIVVGACTIITAWGAVNVKKVADTSERTEAKVDQVKKQTDGQVTANLKTLAVSAENLSIAKNTPENVKAAADAWRAYDDRVRTQEIIDASYPTTHPPP